LLKALFPQNNPNFFAGPLSLRIYDIFPLPCGNQIGRRVIQLRVNYPVKE
jgi:hypothetical protein